MQPAAQQPAAHCGHALVHHREQCVGIAAGKVAVDFEVAAGGSIQNHTLGAVFVRDAAYMRQVAALGILDVLQQAAGRAHCQA